MDITTYSTNTITKVQQLRRQGKTYAEICHDLNIPIPKSTMSSWCHDVLLPRSYANKIKKINKQNLIQARKIALKTNKNIRLEYLNNINKKNKLTAKTIHNYSVGLIALAMLCLGEASKSKTKHRQFSLGSSDSRIIIIFLKLLKRFKGFDQSKIRCTVQCRADQNKSELENYWQNITQVPKSLFYPTRTDPRTLGKPTTKINYKGVLVVDYYNRKIQLMLESLADLVYNQLKIEGP